MRVGAFVGREREIAHLRVALRDAVGGSGSVVLLAGEAGIGKTSVALEISRAATLEGMRVVWGPAIEAEGTPPYWCWRQALTALARTPEGAAVPDLEALESANQFVLFEAVVAALQRGAEPHGLLVVLDDLHWADSGSLRLLQVAAAQVPSSRLLVLGTYRPPPPDASSPLALVLPALSRERAVSRLSLGGLGLEDVDSLLRQTVETRISAGVVRTLLEQTDGIPFYLVELVDALRGGTSRTQLPASLRDIPRRRLQLVGKVCRDVLAAAAVIGREFPLELLLRASSEQRSDVLDALTEASQTGLVEQASPGVYRFAHALLREALYEDLPLGERQRTHLHVAAAIAAWQVQPRDARVDAIAHHLRHALPLSDSVELLSTTIEAGQAAERQLAFEQAAEHYLAAVELTGTMNGQRQSRLSLRISLARCLYRAGLVHAAWTASEAAAEAARLENNAVVIAEAALIVRGKSAPSIAHAQVQLCREALARLGGTNAVLEARLLGQLSVAARALPTTVLAEPSLADQALEASARCGDLEAHWLALQGKELELANAPDQAHVRLALSEQAVQVANQIGDAAIDVWAHAWRLGASWELGLRREADQELMALAAAVERSKEPQARWRLEVSRCSLALIDGRYADAERSAETAMAIGERGGFGWLNGMPRVLRHIAQSRTGDADIALAELRADVSRSNQRLWYAVVLADMGRVAELRELWPGGSALAQPGQGTPPLIALQGMSKVAIALNDRHWAAQVYEQLLPFAGLHVVFGALGGYDGPVALYCGRLAAFIERPQEAERHLRQALVAAAAIGSPPFEAFARYELARLLAKRNRVRDRADAASLLEQARAVAERLGMGPLCKAATGELDLLQHPRGRASPLSPRELEVTHLIAAGLSNRAIGAELHISERTAENHVKNIMDKLGLDSRAQVAIWSARQAEK